jgi:hypothetical protein
VTIFVEGGGNSDLTLRRCRQGFTAYCGKLAPRDKRPKIVACGGRKDAFDDFMTAIKNGGSVDTFVLLVDSEERVTVPDPIEHLRRRDGSQLPERLGRHRVFLMVQAMEAWFLADREILADYYDGGFRPKGLPGRRDDIESVPKGDLEPGLKQATRDTRTKGQYHKTRHGFDLLAKVDPVKIEKGSAQAAAFHQFLRNL